jgi:hypothetical protein
MDSTTKPGGGTAGNPGATARVTERPDVLTGVTPEEERKGGPPEAIEKLAQPDGEKRVSESEILDATEWLLGDEAEDEEALKTLEINVGTTRRQVVQWTIRPIEPDEMRQIRRRAMGLNRQQRRRGATGDQQVDDFQANLLIVTEATVIPNVREVAMTKGLADPSAVVLHRFRHKPGLIDQIAAEIMLFSGWDEEDIQEAKEVRAASG